MAATKARQEKEKAQQRQTELSLYGSKEALTDSIQGLSGIVKGFDETLGEDFKWDGRQGLSERDRLLMDQEISKLELHEDDGFGQPYFDTDSEEYKAIHEKYKGMAHSSLMQERNRVANELEAQQYAKKNFFSQIRDTSAFGQAHVDKVKADLYRAKMSERGYSKEEIDTYLTYNVDYNQKVNADINATAKLKIDDVKNIRTTDASRYAADRDKEARLGAAALSQRTQESKIALAGAKEAGDIYKEVSKSQNALVNDTDDIWTEGDPSKMLGLYEDFVGNWAQTPEIAKSIAAKNKFKSVAAMEKHFKVLSEIGSNDFVNLDKETQMSKLKQAGIPFEESWWGMGGIKDVDEIKDIARKKFTGIARSSRGQYTAARTDIGKKGAGSGSSSSKPVNELKDGKVVPKKDLSKKDFSGYGGKDKFTRDIKSLKAKIDSGKASKADAENYNSMVDFINS
jgi:hypothetical protein